jgi:hypothetical protein
VVAVQDLGALGAATGAPASIFYTPIYNLWSIAPWLLLVPFLALKRNRNASSWWILAPLVAVSGVLSLAASLLSEPTNGMTDELQSFFAALGVAFGVVWLLAAYLEGKPRWLIFLIMLATMTAVGVISGIAYAAQKGMMIMFPAVAIGMAFLAFNASLAFWLASLLCRKRCTPSRFVVCLLVMQLACWFVSSSPFALIGLLINRAAGASSQEILPVVLMILSFGTITFLVALPFLLLSFLHPAHRARLNNLLAQNQAPPLAAPISPETPAGLPPTPQFPGDAVQPSPK